MNNVFEFNSDWSYKIYADIQYKKEFDIERFLEKVNNFIPYKLTSIKRELVCFFYDVVFNEPSCYYNKEILSQTIDNLNNLIEFNSSIRINNEMMELFIAAYNAYIQITSVINDLSGLNERNTIKNRLYRLPTYVSIVESCLTNLFRFIILLLNQTTEKDYSSIYRLNPVCEILVKNGYAKLVEFVDINIRNAVNHGGSLFLEDGNRIVFHYNDKGKSLSKILQTYELDQLIDDVYDTASAVLLGVSIFINNNWSIIDKSVFNEPFLDYNLFGMSLSIPNIRCRYISEAEHFKQLNAEFDILNTERFFIIQTGVMLAILLYSKYNDYDKYYISFSNDRLTTSWMRFSNDQLSQIIHKKRNLSEIVKEVILNESMIFDASTENVDLQEIKYFRFPNYKCDLYKISDINDASTPDRKRLRCKVYIGGIDSKELILRIINECIDWVKNLKNVDSPTMHQKSGEMEADAIYMNVYRNDSRKNKDLMPSNDNFVCFVDYNLSGETTLLNGGLPIGVWNQFHHETIGKIKIAWREGKYLTVHKKKIGVNDPCPCGSGKKFKKCCRGNGMFD